MMSPTGGSGSNGTSNTIALTGAGSPHHVNADYLKNVMLQFLEKDKKMQIQLIPVLSQLLKFSGYVLQSNLVNDVCMWERMANTPYLERMCRSGRRRLMRDSRFGISVSQAKVIQPEFSGYEM